MSKLYEQYKKLKQNNKNNIYIFKNGIFYIALDDDAKKLSDIFGFKLVDFYGTILKCGFPLKKISYYSEKLEQNKIPFEFIDPNYNKIDNFSNYVKNEKIRQTIQSIINMDMNNTTFQEAFTFLQKLQIELKDFF